MTNQEVAECWINGKADCHTANVFYENNTIYSYGYHFPIATIKGRVVYFNNDKYSRSTSKHQTYIRGVIPERYDVVFTTTKELKELLNI